MVLRESTLKHMIHRPCTDKPESMRQRDGKCTRGFPKNFCDETTAKENDFYVTYRRRSPGWGGEQASLRVRSTEVLVVPNNPELLRLFDCHINLELVLSIRGSVKYLFKYTWKGPDRSSVNVVQDRSTGEDVKEIN